MIKSKQGVPTCLDGLLLMSCTNIASIDNIFRLEKLTRTASCTQDWPPPTHHRHIHSKLKPAEMSVVDQALANNLFVSVALRLQQQPWITTDLTDSRHRLYQPQLEAVLLGLATAHALCFLPTLLHLCSSFIHDCTVTSCDWLLLVDTRIWPLQVRALRFCGPFHGNALQAGKCGGRYWWWVYQCALLRSFLLANTPRLYWTVRYYSQMLCGWRT